jgi:hypothetical protein
MPRIDLAPIVRLHWSSSADSGWGQLVSASTQAKHIGRFTFEIAITVVRALIGKLHTRARTEILHDLTTSSDRN